MSPLPVADDNDTITTWQQFRETVGCRGCNLLNRLDDFPNSVLVTGCQRSGTTMLARIIHQSDGMVDYWTGPDDELDAALILSGYRPHEPRGRYCFQTTYVDECYHEYLHHSRGQRIIWVVRNPFSTIYSLLYNWRSGAVERTFRCCCAASLPWFSRLQYQLLGTRAIPRVVQACSIYNEKMSQLRYLSTRLKADQLLVVDYDELVAHKAELLPRIYEFIELAFREAYLAHIHSESIDKARALTRREREYIERKSQPLYARAKQLV